MTVPTTTNKVIGEGDGVATVFPFTFGTLPAGNLVVTLFDTVGTEIPQVENTDYTVLGKGAEDGGSVVFAVAPPAGYTVLIQRILPTTQPDDLKNQGSYYPRTVERMFDRVTMLIQQVVETIGRTLRLPPQVQGVSTELPVPDPSALVGWAPDGTQLQNYRLSDISTNIAYGNKEFDIFTGTGAQVNFTMSRDPGSLGNLDVSIDGVTQVPGTDYNYLATTLTFSTAPASSAVILVRYDVAVPVGTGLSSAIQYTPPQTGVPGSVQSFLNSLWATGTQAGAALVRFLQSGTDAVARDLQAKARELFTVKDFGAAGDGTADDRAAFLATLTAGSPVIPPGTYRIATSMTISKAAQFLPGAVIRPAAGAVITVSARPIAGQQIFDTSAGGSFLLTDGARDVDLAWFGMSASASAATNTAAFDAAMAAITNSDGAVVRFPAGRININPLLCQMHNIALDGSGNRATWLINNSANQPAIEIRGPVGDPRFYNRVSNMRIGQASGVPAVAGNCGVKLLRTANTDLSDIELFNFPGPLYQGFLFDNANDMRVHRLWATNLLNDGYRFKQSSNATGEVLHSYSNGGIGMYFSGVAGNFISDVHVYDNDGVGVHWSGADGNNFHFFAKGWIIDTSGSFNMLMQDLKDSTFGQSWASTQQNPAVNTFATGVYIETAQCRDITFTGCQFNFNNAHGATVTNNALNIRFVGCKFGSSTHGNGRAGSGAGIRIENATDVTVTGCGATGNASEGCLTTAVASNYLVIVGNNFRSNLGASFTNGSLGANNQIANNAT